jgi:hypothetical protein
MPEETDLEVILTGSRCGATGISLNDLKIDKGVNMNKLSPDETDLEVILTGSRTICLYIHLFLFLDHLN